MEFTELIGEACKLFESFDPLKPVRVISHLDADGIAACSIIVNILKDRNMDFALSIVTQMTKDLLKQISFEEYEQYIFIIQLINEDKQLKIKNNEIKRTRQIDFIKNCSRKG